MKLKSIEVTSFITDAEGRQFRGGVESPTWLCPPSENKYCTRAACTGAYCG